MDGDDHAVPAPALSRLVVVRGDQRRDRVFTKLGINSRNQLYRVLPGDLASAGLPETGRPPDR
jgi:hypothetical protein